MCISFIHMPIGGQKSTCNTQRLCSDIASLESSTNDRIMASRAITLTLFSSSTCSLCTTAKDAILKVQKHVCHFIAMFIVEMGLIAFFL